MPVWETDCLFLQPEFPWVVSQWGEWSNCSFDHLTWPCLQKASWNRLPGSSWRLLNHLTANYFCCTLRAAPQMLFSPWRYGERGLCGEGEAPMGRALSRPGCSCKELSLEIEIPLNVHSTWRISFILTREPEHLKNSNWWNYIYSWYCGLPKTL